MIEQTQEKAEERGPEINALLDAFRISMTQILSNLDPKIVCLQTSAMMLATVAPQIAAQCKALSAQMSAPPPAPGGGGAPGMAPPLGMGPMGASPMPPMPPGVGGMGGATAGLGASPAPVTPPVVGG